MASFNTFLSEEQFQCSICLDVFTDPVSTPCGHNFCKACISRYWDSITDVCQCPICKKTFENKPDLSVNTFIAEMASEAKKLDMSTKTKMVKSSSITHKHPIITPGQVPCDVCTENRFMAQKSCLVCLASFCESHLEPHKRLTFYKKHKLIDPVLNLEDRVCKKHDKSIELFCRSDQTYLCQFCIETDHKAHKTVSIEEEYGERKRGLARTMANVQQMIQERHEKVRKIKTSVELGKKDVEKDIADAVEVYTSLMRCIERSQAELIEVIEKKQKEAEQQAEGLITELEQEITELKKSCTELEQISLIEDHFQLLQTSPLPFPPTKDRSEIRFQRSLCVGTVRRTVSQLEETLNEEMKNLCEIELRGMQHSIVDVTLDPDTAHPYLILSKDRKQVKLGEISKLFSNNRYRFSSSVSVLGKEGFSSGRFYYEVQVMGKTAWVLGVVRESINRKGSITRNPENGHWVIRLWDGFDYRAHAGPDVHLSLRKKPQSVGVFVDYEEGQVSFYNVENRSHIYSFTGCKFTEKLFPCFSPGLNSNGKNAAPLIICPARKKD
ncbi:E3 ubiquitin-protein ligase TRIM39-like [Esox lucius]|uniref:E3 ubiquitin-protein ligase TRIM39-like n=1 Tax=Esox lucius TaxID=8010 RepID=A0AAY5KAS6_ESOLU|nr:E3 ubiquitin-protein ligase TRIM39-like [Esox lucius]